MDSIKSLQHMLDQLARNDPALPRLIESGTFDEATLEAVMIFQRDTGLPVNGIVDQTVWNTLVDTYYLNLLQTAPPPCLHVIPTSSTIVQACEQAASIQAIQAMFSALQTIVSNFESVINDGINDGNTTHNLKQIQALSAQKETGSLDRATWKYLSSLFRALVTLNALDTSPL